MNRSNEITEELKDMGSMLANLSRAMPYALPHGYFEERLAAYKLQLPADDQHSAEMGISYSKSMPHSVPAGYFEGLAGSIMTAAKAEAGTQWSKTMPHIVPAGYFESLPGQALAAAKRATPAKKTSTLIALDKAFSQMRWAAAAVLLVCITLGGYISFFSGGTQNGTDMMLASVASDDINDYLRAYPMDVDGTLNNTDISSIQIDNNDIEQYLNETGWDVLD